MKRQKEAVVVSSEENGVVKKEHVSAQANKS